MIATLQRVAHGVGFHIHKWPSNRHLHIEYPVSTEPRWGYGKPAHPQINAKLEQARESYRQTLTSIANRKELLASIPEEPTATGPGLGKENIWLPPLDATSLMHFLLEQRPTHYLEIGSGMSTKFARHAVRSGNLSTKIVSIDPQPRAEIDSICDEVIRHRLETVDLAIFDRLRPGDILFFDGSHRAFMDSDVTVFFLDVLPRIASGVLIQVHDIFWPFDYPPHWGARYYSEQYMLGMLLLHGDVDVVLPNHFAAKDRELSDIVSPLLPRSWSRDDGSFWFRKRS